MTDETVVAFRPGRRRLEFRLFADIDPAIRKRWLVSNFLGEAELSCVYGPPSSFKSGFAGDVAAHIGSGQPFCGRRVAQGAVLYIACERGALVLRRFRAWRLHHGIHDMPLGIVCNSIDLRGSSDDIVAVIGCAHELRDTVRQEIRLIVIDTVSRALAGGDENSPRDVGMFVTNIAKIQQSTGAHVMLLHHVPVDGPQRMRGHGALLAACDTTISIERMGDVRIAAIDKTNDGDEGQKVAFTVKSVELHYDPDTGETTTAPVAVPADIPSSAPAEPKLNKNQMTMFQILHGAGPTGLTGEEWNNRAREAGIGLSRRADLHDYREALKSKGRVRQYGDRWTVAT